MREPATAPPEFVSYVGRRLRALEHAASRLTGDDLQAERVARELMTLVALRWHWSAKADARHGRPTGRTADMQLTKLFRQEAHEYRYPEVVLDLDETVTVARRSTLAEVLPAADDAELIWEAGRRRLRRRLVILAAAGGVGAVAALCRRGRSGAQSPQDVPPLAEVTELPDGALALPSGALPLREISWLPDQLSAPQGPPALSVNPIERAVMLTGPSNVAGGRIFALADDGGWRHVDAVPDGAAAWLTSGALSPDGKRAVLVTPAAALILELTTGQARTLPGIAGATTPVWLSGQQVLVAKDALFDLDTGTFGPAPVGPQDAVTPRGRREMGDRATTLTALLPLGEPLTASARVSRWSLSDPAAEPVTMPLSGQLARVVGRWQGAGVGFNHDRVARACSRRDLPQASTAHSVVAVVLPESGEVVKALVVDVRVSGTVTLLGWQDERRVLVSLTTARTQQIVTWDLLGDRVTRGAVLEFTGVVSLRDLTRSA